MLRAPGRQRDAQVSRSGFDDSFRRVHLFPNRFPQRRRRTVLERAMGIMAFQLQPDPAVNSGYIQIERDDGSPTGKDILRCRSAQNGHDTPSIACSESKIFCAAQRR